MSTVERNISQLKNSICCIKKQLLNGDIIINNSNADFPAIGELNKLYISTNTGIQYYWNGMAYLPLASQISITVKLNYSDLPLPTTVSGEFYWVSNSQGTAWLPGSLGGTYYPKGLYYSNGISWKYLETPYQATQSEVQLAQSGAISTISNDISTLSLKVDLTAKESTLLQTESDLIVINNGIKKASLLIPHNTNL